MRKKSLLYLGNKLSKKGKTISSVETLGALLQIEGYHIISASTFGNKALRILDMLWATVRYSRQVSVVLIDTYSTQNFYYAVVIGKLCRILNLPYIPILHGGNLPSRLKRSPKLCKRLFAASRTNVAPSMYLYEAFKAEGYTNLTYIPNTIEIEKYAFLKRDKLRPRLLWVRSFSEIYNPQLAIEVLEILKERGLNPSLCMVGPEKDGSLLKCKELASRKQLDVTFTGMLSKEEWTSLSTDYDIFINTTNFDNTPVSVIEAMALGLPIISTNVGGLPYLIEDQIDGVLVPPREPLLFAKAIQNLIVDSPKALMLAQNARAKAEGFDWQNIKHSWITLLNH